jgi:hypothetical protein
MYLLLLSENSSSVGISLSYLSALIPLCVRVRVHV